MLITATVKPVCTSAVLCCLLFVAPLVEATKQVEARKQVEAGNQAPTAIDPDQTAWLRPPTLPGVSGSWLLGGERDTGLYQFRVRLEPGAMIPPHTHPDTRNTTVLAGTLWVGFGDAVSKATMIPVPAGNLYTAPANQPHYLWARDGAVEYQENGVGPSATIPAIRDN